MRFFSSLPGERDADLEEITKKDVLLFMKHIHPSSPSRSKLSVHLVSQKLPSPKIITIAAAEAFEDVVRNSQLSVDEDGWR
jgi:insulysin